MNEKTVIVQNLEFLQIGIFGEYFPLASSIECVLMEIKDVRNKKKFQGFSNDFTAHSYSLYNFPINIFDASSLLSWYASIDRENLSAIELRIMLCQNILEQCNIVGYDFCGWMQANFTVTWFDFLMGNVGLGDIQNRRKIITTLLSIPNINVLSKLSGKKFVPDKEIESKKELSRFTHYRKSVEFLELFRDSVFEAMRNDSFLVHCCMAAFETEKQLFKKAEELPKTRGVLFCKQCNRHFDVSQGNTSPLCKGCNKKKTGLKSKKRLDDNKKY